MESRDTVELLKECDSGSKMAVSSIDEILEKVADKQLKQILQTSKGKHEELGNEIHSLLKQYAQEEKEPNPIAKGMSYIKTNMKLGMNHSDKTVAELITDGCDMGIKSLNQYKNQYKTANEKSIHLCEKLISLEEDMRRDLQKYL